MYFCERTSVIHHRRPPELNHQRSGISFAYQWSVRPGVTAHLPLQQNGTPKRQTPIYQSSTWGFLFVPASSFTGKHQWHDDSNTNILLLVSTQNSDRQVSSWLWNLGMKIVIPFDPIRCALPEFLWWNPSITMCCRRTACIHWFGDQAWGRVPNAVPPWPGWVPYYYRAACITADTHKPWVCETRCIRWQFWPRCYISTCHHA